MWQGTARRSVGSMVQLGMAWRHCNGPGHAGWQRTPSGCWMIASRSARSSRPLAMQHAQRLPAHWRRFGKRAGHSNCTPACPPLLRPPAAWRTGKSPLIDELGSGISCSNCSIQANQCTTASASASQGFQTPACTGSTSGSAVPHRPAPDNKAVAAVHAEAQTDF